ncbi:hypothetical protein A2914_02830 [Candidatus Nomurabacteria bacterium RIFCSPLOWO2_01_FULL_41_21]|uniref:Uncharacterized protein n=2 Tax=Candidatus Nomuraibacteriota TaxID=1752729 RepID=A0A1F6X495_9BACT|nr:MAG: hypothetical protein A2647_02465 [Candidatus Nomurabacteria bacterium RIFCSPHIGHO2_01_FULL_40_24b]OGI88868.1 MAG: hypothetical protein A2914_02830 [Candidatus Nomurabacteria bacterium RIFCSPLOWO2_01_FULL_41_21]
MEPETKTKKIETLADDMAKVLKENKDGLIQKVIHEEEEHEEEKKQFSPESPQNKRFLLGGSVFLLLAFGALLYFILNKEAFTVEVAPQFAPLIFTDHYSTVNIGELTKEEIAGGILLKIGETGVEKGGIEGVYLAEGKKILGLSDFSARIGSTLKATEDNFLSENFLLGIFVTKTKPFRTEDKTLPKAEGDLFFLLKTRSFTDVFTDLQIWEEKMFADLHDFFGVPVNAETAYLLTKDFVDGIIHNKNARILYDTLGGIVMMYVYADETSVIITDSPEATGEVILRLSGSRIKK